MINSNKTSKESNKCIGKIIVRTDMGGPKSIQTDTVTESVYGILTLLCDMTGRICIWNNEIKKSQNVRNKYIFHAIPTLSYTRVKARLYMCGLISIHVCSDGTEQADCFDAKQKHNETEADNKQDEPICRVGL